MLDLFHHIKDDNRMLITMSDQDINRYKILQDVLERRLRQVDAAKLLQLTT